MAAWSRSTRFGTVETDIPARLDRLPWSRWHWMILVGLGTRVDPRPGLHLQRRDIQLALTLTKFFRVDDASAPWYIVAYAAGNLAGPLVLGPFDGLGRKPISRGPT